MRELKKEELTMIDGGADPVLVGTIVGIIITFVVGILHGYANPKSFNN